MIELKHISKSFNGAFGTVEALNDVSFSIEDGDIFGIIGMSGAGKSTLVRCINLLERPTSGEILIDGVNVGELNKKDLLQLRRSVSMIFQHFNLLAQRTCLKNVCLPLELIGTNNKEAEKKALQLLDIVGLADKANAYPSQLSGGQQQRVAIARALATNPKILLCDEATSALDPTTTCSILDLIRDINNKMGITVVIITHQMNVVEDVCKHVAILENGEVKELGEVSDVFSHPKSSAGRKLVFPEGEGDMVVAMRDGEKFIRVVFNGEEATGSPMIARLALECGIEANIAYASTKNIENKVFGSMMLGIVGGDAVVKKAINFLKSSNIYAEEVASVHA